jgi:hypothetical protein
LNSRSTSKSILPADILRALSKLSDGLFRAAIVTVCLLGFSFSPVCSQQFQKKDIPLEKLMYPESRLCLLDPCGSEAVIDPFDVQVFYQSLLSLLRSADYLTVLTQSDVKGVLARNRTVVPEVYDPEIMARICKLTQSDHTAFLHLITCEIDRESGFSIPVLFHRNKVTFRVELDVAVVEGKAGSLQYSRRVEGRQAQGRGVQIYPVSNDDPNLYFGFRQREKLARLAMQDLARNVCEAVLEGIHKPLGTKYVCYWQDEVHIISDKPGLCPICGSRLVKLFR